MATITAEQKAAKVARKDSAGAWWIVQAITGLLLILLLGLHMIAHHFVVEGGLRNFDEVIEYISNPIIFVLEVLFLIVVTPHAMLGLQSILMDLGPSAKAERNIRWIVRILTVLIIIYGVWLAIALQQL
jgi:succinate dehydrogenase / fumarate reductase membrane anchor subunit